MRRGAIAVVLLLAWAAPANAHDVGRLVFPIVGGASYFNDFGAPRPQGSHQGNDLMAPRASPVVAVADGVVKLHTSGRGGYMLYLTTRTREYAYIHLNNDRTAGNDNAGGPETAYAPGIRTGTRVHAGQLIAYTATPAMPTERGRTSTSRPVISAAARSTPTASSARRRSSSFPSPPAQQRNARRRSR